MEHVGFLFILLLPAAKVHSSSLASVTQWEKKMQPLLGGRKRSAERQDFTFFMRGFFLQSHHSAILNSSEKMREKKKKEEIIFVLRNNPQNYFVWKWSCSAITATQIDPIDFVGTFLGSGLRQQPLFCGCFYKYSITLSCCAID